VQVVGFFDFVARLCAGDGPIAQLVGTARSNLCCDKRIQVTFPSAILSDYVHPNDGRCSAQIPQLDTPQASKESHNSIHNLGLGLGLTMFWSH